MMSDDIKDFNEWANGKVDNIKNLPATEFMRLKKQYNVYRLKAKKAIDQNKIVQK